MCEIDRDLSMKLSRLSFVAAAMVVLQHAYAPYWSGVLETILCCGLVIWDVPYFFIVAGFMVFKDWDVWNFKLYKSKICGRVRSLFVPYVLWTIYGIILGAVAVVSGLRTNSFCVNDSSWWLSATGISEASMYAGHLWFIRRLFLFVLISPLVAWCAKRIGWGLVPIFMLMFVLGLKSYGTWSNLSFFYFGACSAIRSDAPLRMRIEKKWTGAIFCIYLLALAFRYVTICSDIMIVYRIGELTAIVAGLMFFNALYDNWTRYFCYLDWFKQCSFIVYCSHQSLYQFIKTTVKLILPVGGLYVAFMIALVLSIAIAFGLKRLSPRFYAIVSGGR